MINQSQKLSPEAQEELFEQIATRLVASKLTWPEHAENIVIKYKNRTTIKGLKEMLDAVGYNFSLCAIDSRCRKLRKRGKL